jgi:predicted pyridoxine 5'-phosphate oxidase superfamily flavin-nucleotide-binding protein
MNALENIALARPENPVQGQQEWALQHGRHLALVSSLGDDLVEIRAPGGLVELRIRLTAEGPVLQMESLRLSMKATQDVDITCANFSVRSRDAMTLHADGALRIQGETDLHVDAQGEVHVKGTSIHLN